MKYSGETTYELQVAGLTRVLPVVQVSDGVWVASFVMLGDSELVNACAEELAHRLLAYDFDYLVGPEAVLPTARLATTLTGTLHCLQEERKGLHAEPLVVYARSIAHQKTDAVLDEWMRSGFTGRGLRWLTIGVNRRRNRCRRASEQGRRGDSLPQQFLRKETLRRQPGLPCGSAYYHTVSDGQRVTIAYYRCTLTVGGPPNKSRTEPNRQQRCR